jgi:hypothetical protein
MPLACYMCPRPATSDEHVPPKCIFPKAKEIAGGDLRKNLITVPSCDEHNTQKSADDEFLMVSLAGIVGNNSIGYRHKLGRVDRAMRRSSGRLLDKLFKSRERPIRLNGDEFMEVIWGTPDVERLHACFDRVVRGLFFHHFKARFEGKVVTLLGYLHHTEKNSANFTAFLKHRAALDLANKPRLGANPDVFYFQVTDRDEFGISLFRLCFYGGLDIYSSLIPEGANVPANLATLLIEKGMKTVIRLEGKEYRFNND